MSDVKPHYQLVGLDCPDPIALANFYSQLTGLEVEPLGDFKPEDVEWIELDNGAHPTIAFQKVPNYVAPTWPTGAVPSNSTSTFSCPISIRVKPTRSQLARGNMSTNREPHSGSFSIPSVTRSAWCSP